LSLSSFLGFLSSPNKPNELNELNKPYHLRHVSSALTADGRGPFPFLVILSSVGRDPHAFAEAASRRQAVTPFAVPKE
jgi:hypothetical protein